MNFLDHLRRVSTAASNVYTLSNLSSWISKYTYHEGRNFSYDGHEYQPKVIDDDAAEIYVVKCAQTGLSEIFARWGVAACATQPNFTLIWTFPSTSDAEKFTKARLNPMIAASPEIKAVLNSQVDGADLKQFGDNSFAYIRGTISDTGGLSVPADLLIHDELDKSNLDMVSTYVSRLQHKPTKKRRLFSTPTQSKYGISLLAESSRRYREIWKCSHCNHHFLPSFENDIHIPGWDKPKREITRSNVKDIAVDQAVMLCPSCFKVPSTDVAFREWVLENNAENYEAKSYFISPFSAPKILTPSYLVGAVPKFNKWSEFQNQVLGLPAEDSEDILTRTDVEKSFVSGDLGSTEVHYMGVDMGLTCHFTIAYVAHNGELVVVHREKVNYTKMEEQRNELKRRFRVAISVHDMFPYTDLINRVTTFDPNAYGAIYVERKTSEVYSVHEVEPNPEEGKLNVRNVKINRHVAFDQLMAKFKDGKVIMKDGEDHEEVVAQMTDMRRVQAFDRYGSISYQWRKGAGDDHYHHSLMYCMIAAELRGTITGFALGIPNLVTTFKRKG